MSEDRIKIGDLSPGDVALLKDVAEVAADNAVKKWLVAIGIDPNNPVKAQQEFTTMRYVIEKVHDTEFKDDLSWLRRARKNSEGIIGKAVLTAVGLSVVGAVHAMWQGLRAFLGQPPG